MNRREDNDDISIYDHKCKEKCQICKEIRRDNNDIKQCTKESGHFDNHLCEQFHNCLEICVYSEYAENCNNKCILEFGHKEKHHCGVKEHHCKEKCHLYGKANGCDGKCNSKNPLEKHQHECGNIHKCKEECRYKNDSKPEFCDNICNQNYGHKEIHHCGKIHNCNHDCDYKNKSRGCDGKCTLPYPHENSGHTCNKIHKCNVECKYINDSKPESCDNICNEVLNKDYTHEGIHKCGKEHKCNHVCDYKDKARGCNENGKCNLTYPHEGREHNCLETHKCKEQCHLKGQSKLESCDQFCNKDYGHNDGIHICNKEKNEHICNKKCQINQNCNRDCKLSTNHPNLCLCGQCACQENCIYKDISNNCRGQCDLNCGHEEPHKCRNEHYCKEKCEYYIKYPSCSSCEINCKFKYGESHSEHICRRTKIEHICNKICDLSEISNCKGHCKLSIEHEKSGRNMHICNAQAHICIKDCGLKDYSRSCYRKCKYKVEANDTEENFKIFKEHNEHICSTVEHKCKNNCSYFTQNGIRCNNKCTKTANHNPNERCKCSGTHICEEKCKYSNYNNFPGCRINCSKTLGHTEGEHKCNGIHVCNKNCDLKELARGCNDGGRCTIEIPHGNNHKCSAVNHYCRIECHLRLSAKSNSCLGICTNLYNNHQEHKCNSEHYCNKKCEYPDCNKECCYKCPHNGKCKCKDWHENLYHHLCKKQCYLQNAKGCKNECKLEYGHQGNNHRCFIDYKNNPHTCNHQCQLCDKVCGHVYNHQNDHNFYCSKCEENSCRLNSNHLCGNEHQCNKKCNHKGICHIETTTKDNAKYRNRHQTIIYKQISSKEPGRYTCNIPIPKNKLEHSDPENHKCYKNEHLCGFQCQQCKNYCTETIDHKNLHKTAHGNMENSSIKIIGSSGHVEVKSKNEYYKFDNEESATVFSCEEYCRSQGQGHTHLISKSTIDKLNNKNEKEKNCREYDSNYYECKCSFFWEKILEFDNQIEYEIKRKFELCDCVCPCDKQNQLYYCQRELWHMKNIPEELKGKWLSPEGHKFDCEHPSGIYTIFLIDTSGSMDSEKTKPSNEEIQKSQGLNNMLGSAIEVLLHFTEVRNAINRREKCALIGFDNYAVLKFKDKYVNEPEIKKKCLELKTGGRTEFKEAFNISK